MHRNVPSSVLCDFISGLQRLEADGPLVVGSLFSCSEISAKVLDCLASHYRSELDIGLVIHHAFMCEKSIIRRQHLRWEFPTAGALYDDAEKIRHGKLANLIESECPTGPLKPPTYASLVHGGFSCVSKSPANSKRSENKGCLSDADNTCETAVTFRAFKDAVAAEHWETVIAENLIDLMEDGGEDSDANTVIKEFTDLGYTSESYIVRAEEYGSFTVKNMLFSLAFLGLRRCSRACTNDSARLFRR